MAHKITTVRGFIDFIFERYPELNNSEINMMYEGEVTHQVTKAFTSITESKLGKIEEDASVQRKVFHVMVESLQNIDKHGGKLDENDPLSARGIFVVSMCNDGYCVITGNLIDNDKIGSVQTMLDKINNTDADTLKQMHKEQMRSGSISSKGGAGLGFIDIARKTGGKYAYHFIDVNDKVSFFVVKTTILKSKN